MTTYATRNKLILNRQQRQAVELIFGPELARSILEEAQKTVAALADATAKLKSELDQAQARLTALELAAGHSFAGSYFGPTANGRSAKPAAGQLFGGAR